MEIVTKFLIFADFDLNFSDFGAIFFIPNSKNSNSGFFWTGIGIYMRFPGPILISKNNFEISDFIPIIIIITQYYYAFYIVGD